VTTLSSCSPDFIKRQKEAAAPPSNDEVIEAKALLHSSWPISVRGAAADEQPGTEAWRRRAVTNGLLTSYLRTREAPFYRKRDATSPPDGLPRYCIALSGGGMRALAFGTGVLRGLNERGQYERVAVQSAVSGGGYVSYWMARSVQHGATEAQVLAGSDSQQLAHLRKQAGALVSATTRAEFLPFLPARNPATTPARSDWPSTVDDFAVDLLAGTFAAIEMKWGPGHVPYVLTLGRMLGGDSRLSAKALDELVSAGRIPVPVWLVSARPSDAPPCVSLEPGDEITERSRPLTYSAFELGPTRTGSDELSFLTHMLIEPLDAVAVSGAGMSVPFNEQCRLLQLIDASVSVQNYPASGNPSDPHAVPQGSGLRESFVLTDGGIADNLGVFPLVRRLCSDIVVVDAEFDPYLVFSGFGYLKQQLANLDIPLNVPELEAVASKNRAPVAPASPDTPCAGGICFIRPRPECIRRESSAGCIGADHLPTAVYEGELGPIPFARLSNPGTSEHHWEYSNRVLKIHYIKLSLDAAQIDQYPRTVRQRYASQASRRRPGSAPCVATRDNDACSFPHEPTANLDYRGGEFEAYWDLGRCIVERNWPPLGGGDAPGPCSESQW